MTAELPIRDILAMTMRAARLSGMGVRWDVLTEFGKEEHGLIADQVIRRLASDYGIAVVRSGEPIPAPQSPPDVVWRYPLVGSETIRSVRKGADDTWEIVDGEKVVLSFTMAQTFVEAGMVLRGDPSAMKIRGLMTRLAAGLEITSKGAA